MYNEKRMQAAYISIVIRNMCELLWILLHASWSIQYEIYIFIWESYKRTHEKLTNRCSHNLNAVQNCGRRMRNLIENFYRLLMTTNETFDDATTQKKIRLSIIDRNFQIEKKLLIHENSLKNDFEII